MTNSIYNIPNNKITKSYLTVSGNLNPYKKTLYEPVLKKYTTFLDKYSPKNSLRWYCIKNNITSIPTCKYCGKLVNITKNTDTFHDYCSSKCSNNSQEIQNKIKKTNLEKYGTEYYNNPTKIKKTNLEKYGVENVSQLKTTQNKIKINNLEKYGVESTSQLDSVKSLMRQTNLEKYGTDHYNKSDQFKKDIHNISSKTIELLKNYEWLIEQNKIKSLIMISKELNISPSMLGQYYKKHDIDVIRHNNSQEENVIETWLIDNEIQYIKNNRVLISPLELDFYLPDYNLAIEVNGVYWHSELQGKTKRYHLNKTELCEKKEIKLIHIYDNDINNKWELIKSRLESQLGISRRIYARKCKIIEVSNQDSRKFLNDNHIQGNVNSRYSYGLIYENELVSLMTFGKARFSNADYELLRFCNKKGCSVIGGASRLFKKFTKNHTGLLISYADRNWSNGNLYEKLGFEFSHNSPPNYRYTNDYKNLESRNKFMKHKLKSNISNFNKNLTEWENMKLNGYDRIWDCGNKIYTITLIR